MATTDQIHPSATDMPRPVGNYPYLQELHSGMIHPYNEVLAARSDLVRGVYDMNGSTDPKDADPNYDPSGIGGKVATPVSHVTPQNAAEFASQLASERLKAQKLQADNARALAEVEALRKELELAKTATVQQTTQQPVADFVATETGLQGNNNEVDTAATGNATDATPAAEFNEATGSAEATAEPKSGDADVAPAPVKKSTRKKVEPVVTEPAEVKTEAPAQSTTDALLNGILGDDID